MSGRVRWRRDGEVVTGYRKTDRRNPRRFEPFEEPNAHLTLRIELPPAIAGTVSPGPASIIGVTVEGAFGHLYVQVEGHGMEWVLRQASSYLGSIAGATDQHLPFTIACGSVRRAGTMVYVPGASVVVPRWDRKAMVFPVKR